ncbi:MAG: hypothetical protein IIB39_01315 [Candidatus Marinimicrobia bacterium]|nr:hypothetical protein [Candidatus Neomarinimicrobiota bacterium]
MPPRKFPIKLNKFRFGAAFILSIISYNIVDRLSLWVTDYDLWKWIKLNGLQDQSVFILVLAWIGSLILPMLFWYKIAGLFMKNKSG